MKLYKFRSLSNIEYVLDIIYNQRLYCSRYDDLNDPFEGLFLSNLLDLSQRPSGSRLLEDNSGNYRVVASAKHLNNRILEQARICSLSQSMSDVRLWSYYGDGHTGIAIELEVDENDPQLHQIEYSDKLPIFNIEQANDGNVMSLLKRKTHQWAHEQEYRIITSKKHFCISEKICSIYLGSRVSQFYAEILKKAVSPRINIYHTKINPYRVTVERVREECSYQDLNLRAEL